MTGGRPLRFLAGVLGGWATIRIALLMPGAAPLPDLIRDIMPPAAAAIFVAQPRARFVYSKAPPPRFRRSSVAAPAAWPAIEITAAAAAAPVQRRPTARWPPSGVTTIPPPLPPAPIGDRRSRVSGSAWGLIRGGAGGTVSGGQLGASQAGFRILYALGDARRLAITARVATPLRGAGREAAIGLEWRPTDLPFRLIAEQRFALDGGRGGPTVGVIGGYGPAEVVRGIRVEAYGQTGAILRDGIEGFVDVSARVSHPVASIGDARFDVAVGAWASAQRDAERFDIGPSVGVVVPVAHRSLRLNIDWRQRIAGQARPGSGPALSIGSDF